MMTGAACSNASTDMQHGPEVVAGHYKEERMPHTCWGNRPLIGWPHVPERPHGGLILLSVLGPVGSDHHF